MFIANDKKPLIKIRLFSLPYANSNCSLSHKECLGHWTIRISANYGNSKGN